MFKSVLLTEFIIVHTVSQKRLLCWLGPISNFKMRLSVKSERSQSSVYRKMAKIFELMRYSGAYLRKQAWLIILFNGMTLSWITCYM